MSEARRSGAASLISGVMTHAWAPHGGVPMRPPRLSAFLRDAATPSAALDDAQAARLALDWLRARGKLGQPSKAAPLRPPGSALPNQSDSQPDPEVAGHVLSAAVCALCGLPASRGAAALQACTPPPAPRLPSPSGPYAPAGAEEASSVEREAFGTKSASSASAGARWLLSWTRGVLSKSSADLTRRLESRQPREKGDAEEEVLQAATQAALRVLQTSHPDVLAAQLFDALGDAAFEHMEEILSARPSLAANLAKAAEAMIARAAAEERGDRGRAAAPPAPGPTVSISTESERQARRKGAWRGDGEAVGDAKPGSAADWLGVHGIGALAEYEKERDSEHQYITLGGGVRLRLGEGTDGMGGPKGLPVGTVRKVHKGWEELVVPATRPAPRPPGEVPVEIGELPGWAQLAFEGYKELNRIQSAIYKAAFQQSQNLLVCAPTGAGKTNIAMLAVLQQVGCHLLEKESARGGAKSGRPRIDKGTFRIVYVAPMKALAAEVTATFSKRLAPLGLSVRELTGDTQLSRRELSETTMIVTTPEKWDVITRKGVESGAAAGVKLLIIDEVHLLNDERGPVIETLVARIARAVEASQSLVRIVGLSATLPNYRDVASFLGVNHDAGLFYFDAGYRPVPLEMSFAGVSERNLQARNALMDDVAYDKVAHALRRGHQAMVFVHSRKATGLAARALAQRAQERGESALFDTTGEEMHGLFAKDVHKSRNREVQEIFALGCGIHHAGMLRPDRTLTERLFSAGIIRVLCCTATLAWGVNLPAHTVVIKGTQLYNPEKGGFVDLGMLDVQQIFGRAGRPQFQDAGEATIVTTHDKLAHYLGLLTQAVPIESQFADRLVDHLNAEVVLGTVANVGEGARWLSYTYMHTRALKNPLAYGISWEALLGDPALERHRRQLVQQAAHVLERCRMARFDQRAGVLHVTELGRVASHFYISHGTVATFNERLKPVMDEAEVFAILALSSEFDNLAIRPDELLELDDLQRSVCPYPAPGGSETRHGKACILAQAFVSRARVDGFSLSADLNYVSQNAPRIARALFEICLRRGWPAAAEVCLLVSGCLERRLWPDQHPLRQMEGSQLLPRYGGGGEDVLRRLEEQGLDLERLEEMSPAEIGAALRHPAAGRLVAQAAAAVPRLHLEARAQPVTRTVLRLSVRVRPQFRWRDAVHGSVLRWHVWVEDASREHIFHSEQWVLGKRMMHQDGGKEEEGNGSLFSSSPSFELEIIVPVFEPLPPQYFVRMLSDSWLGCETTLAVSFRDLVLPRAHAAHTPLLDLDPLPVTCLRDPLAEARYRFGHLNPIQTRVFHALYHTDDSAFVGAPTGSGKTFFAELAMLRLFRARPGSKVVYVAPLKALVRERVADWGPAFCAPLGRSLVELTGDAAPDARALDAADVIVTTPEKWDAVSRSWESRAYVRRVGLLVLDEIHLLGSQRGGVLEAIVSRMRHVSALLADEEAAREEDAAEERSSGSAFSVPHSLRIVGLSTALANAEDLADWLGVPARCLFNFRPGVRPVPLEAHIQGYAGRFYCPRMASMNRPCYAAIRAHAPDAPALVFVSSRRQTRLTALDLVSHAVADDRARAWTRMDEAELEEALARAQDAHLRHCLSFGIGIHHAGLVLEDRNLVERLFVGLKIQVLVATSTLAWGVNTPAHLVVVKGTEFFDAPSRRYVDYAMTDVLQMMGRAGRPGFDARGVAVVMVEESKKSYYKKFLYEPFPVESSLPLVLPDQLCAEVAAGTVRSLPDALNWLGWSFYQRRLEHNPSFYGLPDARPPSVARHLSNLLAATLGALQDAGCVRFDPETQDVTPTLAGRVASRCYLSHQTLLRAAQRLKPSLSLREALEALCAAAEFDQLPVRHNEDKLNAELAKAVRWPPAPQAMEDPHAKTSLLLQAHLSRLPLPISDYVTDAQTALESCARVLVAFVDVCADAGWLDACCTLVSLLQGLVQAAWPDASALATLAPGAFREPHAALRPALSGLRCAVDALPEFLERAVEDPGRAEALLRNAFEKAPQDVEACLAAVRRMPAIGVEASLQKTGGEQAMAVRLQRIRGPLKKGGAAPSAYAPFFPKIKDEGWWILVGCAETCRLLALKRISFGKSLKTTLKLPSQHVQPGKTLRVYLLSDSYLGLDQEYDVVVA